MVLCPCLAVRHAQDWVTDGDENSPMKRCYKIHRALNTYRKNINSPIPPSPQRPRPCQLLAGQPEGTRSTIDATKCTRCEGDKAYCKIAPKTITWPQTRPRQIFPQSI